MVRLIAFSLALLTCASAFAFAPHDDGTINAVIGDEGLQDHTASSETERIQAHLDYVIAKLELAEIPGLTPSQHHARGRLLAELRDYARAGNFPQRDVDDGWGVRRPRFIDASGVHCAVGELMRRSGHGSLARQIDLEAEYAYVEEMDSSALTRWAEDHGFAKRELAMIQPAYSAPPTNHSVKSKIADLKDALVMQCGMHPVPGTITVKFKGDSHGNVGIRNRPSTPFEKCFIKELSKSRLGSGGAWDSEPRPFRGSVKLRLVSPKEQLETRLERINLDGHNAGCTPRPGAVPRTANVTLTVGAKAVEFDVVTSPNNDEVRACLVEKLRERFRDVPPGLGNFVITAKKDLGVLVSNERLREIIPHVAKSAGLKCWEPGTPSTRKLTVNATPDMADFDVESTGGSDEFTTCFHQELKRRLRSNFTVSRKLADGSYERFFRIDSTVDVEANVELMTPAEKKRQVDEMRRRFDGSQHDF